MTRDSALSAQSAAKRWLPVLSCLVLGTAMMIVVGATRVSQAIEEDAYQGDAQQAEAPDAPDRFGEPGDRGMRRGPREGGIRVDQVEPNDGAEEGLPEGMPMLRRDGRDRERARVRPGYGPQFLPPPPAWRDNWKLGVYATNTNTGVVITQVVPGSAAARVGLEPGDRIVTVGGYQVGYVDGWLYPLGQELQRQVGPGGRLLLLVQNVRNNRLLTIRPRLDRTW